MWQKSLFANKHSETPGEKRYLGMSRALCLNSSGSEEGNVSAGIVYVIHLKLRFVKTATRYSLQIMCGDSSFPSAWFVKIVQLKPRSQISHDSLTNHILHNLSISLSFDTFVYVVCHVTHRLYNSVWISGHETKKSHLQQEQCSVNCLDSRVCDHSLAADMVLGSKLARSLHARWRSCFD